MRNNRFYRFCSKEIGRVVSGYRNAHGNDDINEFDRLFKKSEKYIISREVLLLFEEEWFSSDIDIKTDPLSRRNCFCKEYIKSFILPGGGGFLIEWRPKSKRIFVIDAFMFGPLVLDSIFIIKGVLHSYSSWGYEFEFEEEFKATWNFCIRVAPGAIPGFLMFLDSFKAKNISKDFVEDKILYSHQSNYNKSEWVNINLNHFRKTIVDAKFKVKGHWRNQAYGKNRSLRKKVFINTFLKKGYNMN